MTTIDKNDPRLGIKGVYLHGNRLRVERVVKGDKRRATFDADATADQLIEAYDAMGGDEVPVIPGGLAAAAARYFPTVKSQPTYAEKVAHITMAIAFLGPDTKPATVTDVDIDRLVQHWTDTPATFTKGPRRGARTAPAGLAADTIRKRLSHLQTFFKAILPKRAYNPVKGCSKKPAPPTPEVRGVPIEDVAKLLDAMPDYRDGNRLSLSKIRAAVWAYTGMDPVQIKRLTPIDVKLAGASPTVRTFRKKGRGGVRVITLELTPNGHAAMVAFMNAGACGVDFKTPSLTRSIKRAAAKVGLAWGTFRGKDLRHSFLTQVYLDNRDQATVARFAGHAPGSKMTARYTAAANREIDRAAADKFKAPAFRSPANNPAPATVVSMATRKRGGRL